MGTNRKKSNFILQGGILGIAGIITRIIGMIYRIPVTNIIGPEGNGYYAAAYQVYTVMLLISSYSLPLAVSKIVSARISNGEYKNADKIFKAALGFAFATGTVVCLLIFFGAEFFAGRIMSEPLSTIALRIFAPTLLIVAVMGVVRGYFQGMGTMVPTAVSQIIEQIINAIISILAAKYLFSYGQKVGAILHNEHYASAYGAAGSTLGTSLGALAGLIFLIITLMLVNRTLYLQRKSDKTKFTEDYGFIIKMILITVIPVIMSTAIYNISELLSNAMFNKIMIKKGFESTKSFSWGVYSGEYKILLNVPIALSSAMSASVVPTLTGCMAEGNIKAARRRISQAMRFTLIVAFPCAVGLGVLALPIMSMLFHEGYEMAAKLMQFGCVNIILYSISTLSNGMLQGINKMRIPVINAFISLIVHLSLLYLLLNRTNLQIFSVIICNFVFALLMSVLNHLAIRRYVHYRQEIFRTFVTPGICSGIMGLIIFVMYKVLSQSLSNMVSTLICIAAGAVAYVISLVKLGGIRSDEITAFPMGRSLLKIFRSLHLM